MEIVLLLAVLILVIILFNKNSNHQKTYQIDMNILNKKIDELSRKISNQNNSTLSNNSTVEEEISILREEIQEEKTTPFDEPIYGSYDEKLNTSFEESLSEELTENKEVKAEEESSSLAAFSSDGIAGEVREQISKPYVQEPPKPYVPKKSWLETFKEKNPDIEKFIGENLINKIGILILVLGISFFVKYAIDKDWINEPARVGIGVLAGAIVMGVAHRLRKNYAAFSSVFVAGAISIFYLTIGIAFHDYHLFSQTVAFIIMVVITIFSVLVSVSYNRKELAILSLIGGFAVPFMVSTGEGNYKVLFTYITILNIGMIIIAYFKKWSLVTFLAFLFTCILYSSWFGIEFSSNTLPYRGALFFATGFYLIFSIATVINNIRSKGSFSKLDYFIMVANTFFYFGMGISIIENWKPEYKGLFTVALALYNLVFAFVLYKKFGINKNAIYLLLGITLSFITLAIPIQFHGNYITLFWACEAVLLFWLSQKSKIATFKLGAIVVQVLMLGSLFMDWVQIYSATTILELQPFTNKIFITGLVSVLSLIFTYYLMKREREHTHLLIIDFNPKFYKSIALVLSILVGYMVGMLEIIYQANEYNANLFSAISYPVLYHFVFSVAIIYFVLKSKFNNKEVLSIIISAINIILYITIFSGLSTNEMIENTKLSLMSTAAFIIHYLLIICVAFFIYTIVQNRKSEGLSSIINHKLSLWVLAFCIVYILSNEIMIHGLILNNNIINIAELNKTYPITNGSANEFNYEKNEYINAKFSDAKIQIIKIGYPILWGVLSFVFLIVGIKRQNKQLRIIALSLLGITILKLFLFDIKNVSETGKIIAFILLGVLILIISFVYQKIKKLVVDEHNNTHDEENN